jgi:hypothetical protein
VDLTSSSLYEMHRKGKAKSIVVLNILHLLAVAEFLRHSLHDEISLIIVEDIFPIFLAQKVSV